ncbi:MULTISPECIES: methyltransferase [unclassified Sutcliffiella]|uniref:class I SAM-dependent methyltransferase n=1 Tax=unclassified Sutcliffiella TaxID=2837532 RepID=UPI0030D1EF45
MIKTVVNDVELKFKTNEELFSPKYLDKGTLAMLSIIEFEKNDKVLDLGCGYGLIGILAAKLCIPANITMVDINEKAVKCSKENAKLNGVPEVEVTLSDGYSNILTNDFNKIICHPPYHADFSVAKMIIEKGFNRLAIGGHIYLVTKRKEWYKNKLISTFGGVKIWEIEGYYVFMAIKKESSYSKAKPRKKRKKTGENNKEIFKK